jgi:hypothetical protein
MDWVEEMFGKYGMGDGGWIGCDAMHEKMANHLRAKLPGWKFHRMMGTNHNRRVFNAIHPSGMELRLSDMTEVLLPVIFADFPELVEAILSFRGQFFAYLRWRNQRPF